MITNYRILITGGAGFIGSHIVDALSSHNKVTVLDNLESGSLENLNKSKGNITFVKGDIRDQDTVNKLVGNADYIFHLAANVGNIRSIEDPFFDMEVNTKGTLNILNACAHTNIRKLVYSSSAAIYGDAKNLPVDESHVMNPESPYAVSKMAAEKYCFVFHIIHSIPFIALRYFNVYGPRQGSNQYANVIPIFFRKIRDGENLTIFGDGTQTRDFINVKDIVTANILAAESKLTSGIFNIATGIATSVNQLADHVIGITKSSAKHTYEPLRKGEVLHSVANINAVRNALGYNPIIPIIDGLRDYYTFKE